MKNFEVEHINNEEIFAKINPFGSKWLKHNGSILHTTFSKIIQDTVDYDLQWQLALGKFTNYFLFNISSNPNSSFQSSVAKYYRLLFRHLLGILYLQTSIKHHLREFTMIRCKMTTSMMLIFTKLEFYLVFLCLGYSQVQTVHPIVILQRLKATIQKYTTKVSNALKFA